MSLFQKSDNTQAYLKAGFMGFAGSGKTFTASILAIGLVKLMREKKLPAGDKPAMFIDTETGSDWVQPMFADAAIELHSAKTRAFPDLKAAIIEAEHDGSVLIIDSITHFWRDLTESYAKKKNRTRGLEFQDWAVLKRNWGEFTDLFVNSNAHIILCGRAGYEYDFFENQAGKKELEKTGIKMKAEGETGYEPSILVLMEHSMDLNTRKVNREAHILKDRANRLDGKTFINPKFEDFAPHIEFLNLGGQQFGVDTTRNSEALFERDGKDAWKYREEQKEILLEKVQALFVEHGISGTSKDARQAMIEKLRKHFGTTSWREIELSQIGEVKAGYVSLHIELNGSDPYAVPDEIAKPDAKAKTTEIIDEDVPY